MSTIIAKKRKFHELFKRTKNKTSDLKKGPKLFINKNGALDKNYKEVLDKLKSKFPSFSRRDLLEVLQNNNYDNLSTIENLELLESTRKKDLIDKNKNRLNLNPIYMLKNCKNRRQVKEFLTNFKNQIEENMNSKSKMENLSLKKYQHENQVIKQGVKNLTKLVNREVALRGKKSYLREEIEK